MFYCNFGDILRQLRKANNLTQQELGNRIGLSKAVISKYENCIGYPTFDILIKIANYFNVTTDFLLGVEKGKTINVSDLNDSQIDIICNLIEEFKGNNK